MEKSVFESFNEGKLRLKGSEKDFAKIAWSKHPVFEGVELKHIITAKDTGGAFSYVRLSENTATVEKNAFANCPNLKYVFIPSSTTNIVADAFAGVSNLTILGVVLSIVVFGAILGTSMNQYLEQAESAASAIAETTY